MPVSVWHWQIISMVLAHWTRLGHAVAGEQYVADSGFVRGGTGRNNYVADATEIDGMVTMHELRDGEYVVTAHRLVSRL